MTIIYPVQRNSGRKASDNITSRALQHERVEALFQEQAECALVFALLQCLM